MTVEIQPQGSFDVPVQMKGITPDRLSGMSEDQIAKLEIGYGNSLIELGQLCRVSGSPADQQLVFQGDFSLVEQIGSRMKSGAITIEGNCGSHLGAQMSGGCIRLNSNSRNFVGAEMTGGSIQILGNVGDYLGGNYPGSKRGMNRGQITVAGNVGHFAGRSMRRGLIWIGGTTGHYLGWNMLAGTLVAEGQIGQRAGVGMVRGTLILDSGFHCGPGFVSGGRVRSPIVNLILRSIEKQQPVISAPRKHAEYEIFHGDSLMGSRGEIFVPVNNG